VLSTDKHCELLSSFVRNKSAEIHSGFKLFVQLFSGIVGGSVVLRLQYNGRVPEQFIWLSNALAGLVTITSAIMIITAYYSWYGFRVRMSDIAGLDLDNHPRIRRPKPLLSAKAEFVMLFVMVIAFVGFMVFNPLEFLN